jgi:hypothetical protein
MIQRKCGEALRQRPVLEVYGAELYIGRECDSAFGQMFALDGLTLGVSDLDDAKPCRPARLAVGECIHPCTEQHILPETIGDSLSERVLGVTTPHYKRGAIHIYPSNPWFLCWCMIPKLDGAGSTPGRPVPFFCEQNQVFAEVGVSGHGRGARPRLPNRQKGKPQHTYEFVHDRREPAGTAFLGIFRGMRSVEIGF